MVKQHTSLNPIFVVAACVVVIAGMKVAQSLIVPFLLAGFIAIISATPMFWLQRKGLSKWLALTLVVLAVFVFGISVSVLVGSSLDDFIGKLPFYEDRLRLMFAELLGQLSRFGVSVSSGSVLTYFDPGQAMGFAGKVFKGVGSTLANVFLILLTVLFILGEAAGMRHKLSKIVDDPEHTLAQLNLFFIKVNNYVAIKTTTSLLTGLVVTLWLSILGVDHAVLWGVLAFLFNFIPNIGSIIAAIPAVLLALVQLGPDIALWTAFGYLVVNNVVGNYVEPKFMGQSLGLSSLVVFLSLVFWGWVLGPVGMLLSVPLTMTLKIAMENSPRTRWFSVLLGPDS